MRVGIDVVQPPARNCLSFSLCAKRTCRLLLCNRRATPDKQENAQKGSRYLPLRESFRQPSGYCPNFDTSPLN
jgi:hypothetical protein